MKVRTLIAMLQSLPKDYDVYVCGVDRFFIYNVTDKTNKPFISFDTDEFDHTYFSVPKKGLKIYDSLLVSTQYEVDLARKEKIDEALKTSRVILDALDKKGGK